MFPPFSIQESVFSLQFISEYGRLEDILIVEATTKATFGAGERRFRALIEHISDAIALLNRQGEVIYSGASATHILGYDAGQTVGRDAFSFVHPEDRLAAQDRFAALLQSPGADAPLAYRLRHRDGSWRHVEGIAKNLLNEPGVHAVVVTYRDCTERIMAEATLRESEARYGAVIAALDEGIIVQDPDGRITAANESAYRIFGVNREQLIGRTSLDSQWQTVHEDGAPFPPTEHPAMIALGTGQRQTRVIMGVEKSDGARTWLSVNAQPLFRDDAPSPYAAVTSFTDITERKRADTQLVRAAHYDALTGLPNRGFFMERLAHLFSHARRDEQYEFALLFLDFDHFKAVNDSLGHAVGDSALAAIARRLEHALRPADGVARLGGDEFAILAGNVRGLTEATAIAMRLGEMLATPFVVNGREIHMTASIGIALSGPEYDRGDEMLRDADAAMYRAKREGGGQHAVADAEMRTRAHAADLLGRDLRDAMARGQMHVVFEPVIDLQRGRVAHFDARLRWMHPAFGPLSSASFLSIADEIGVRAALDHALLRTACHQLRRWQDASHENGALAVSVRVSGAHFVNPHFVREYAETVRHACVAPHSLILQFAERVVLDHPDAAAALFRHLHAIGTRVQVNQFGAGNTSLLFLRRFAIDVLKIDRTVVAMLADETGRAIVGAVMTLANTVGMHVVASGIEALHQAHALREAGCDFGQGEWFATLHPHNEERIVRPLMIDL